ncbi:DUF1778 domain-containing protein [Xanthomonas sp. LMG 8992]|nr:DUF1778 domain-containing protein [Xanthomonas sp. LMG 8992]
MMRRGAGKIIRLRLSASTLSLIDHAAKHRDRKRAEFLLEAASEKARDVLSDRIQRVSRSQQWQDLNALVDAPLDQNAPIRHLWAMPAPWERCGLGHANACGAVNARGWRMIRARRPPEPASWIEPVRRLHGHACRRGVSFSRCCGTWRLRWRRPRASPRPTSNARVAMPPRSRRRDRTPCRASTAARSSCSSPGSTTLAPRWNCRICCS